MRAAALILAAGLMASAAGADPVKVGAGNFVRAESDRYMADIVARQGLGTFVHQRDPVSVEDQAIIRMNRDTLYSSGVFDLAAGPVTITLPEGDPRYRAVQVLNQDHLTLAVHHDGTHVLTEAEAGTRYAVILMRTFVDPGRAEDIAAAHAAQDAVKVVQDAGGVWEVPDWDLPSLDATRSALLSLGGLSREGLGPSMGGPGKVDPVAHLIATATGWGLNPPSEAIYASGAVEGNDGQGIWRMTLADVPVDGFWSVSVYNREGFFTPNPEGAYAINNVTGTPGADGAITVQFGGCGEGAVNCIPIMAGWNYTIRLYRPRPEIVDGRWTAPRPEKAG
jgi:hypothetical protein